MPKLRRLSGRDAILTFEKLGFHQARKRGSHVVMRRGDRGCVLPLHKQLAIGTLRSALRQAGVSPDEFMEVYEGK